MNRLEPILVATREEVRRRRETRPLAELEQAAARRLESDGARPFANALAAPGLSLIAEHKRRSPSAGVIREELSLEDVVGSYERGGAAALSILTEGPNFGGSTEDLRAARAESALPLLRKDFIVDRYQLHESLEAGADAVLLIVAALSRSVLAELHRLAGELGLAALVEVHDRDEVEEAIAAGAQIIGINNRDLTTLAVDIRRTFELAPLLPPDVLTVAESGFRRPGELEQLGQVGVDAVLVGEALMRASDIEAAARGLIGHV
jgi:indole-3-glycerol phosphate synthase